MVDDVADGEHPGQAGARRRGGDNDVALASRSSLIGEEFGARVLADGDGQTRDVEVAGGAGEDVTQDDTAEGAV